MGCTKSKPKEDEDWNTTYEELTIKLDKVTRRASEEGIHRQGTEFIQDEITKKDNKALCLWSSGACGPAAPSLAPSCWGALACALAHRLKARGTFALLSLR